MKHSPILRNSRKMLFLFLFITTHLAAHAQWYWSYQVTGGHQSPTMCSTTANGITYVVGGYEGASTFGATTLADAGNGDGFLTKLNTNGTYNWALRVVSGPLADGATVVAAQGNDIFIAGAFRGNATIGSSDANNVPVSGSNLYNNFFLARYNGSGVLQWVETLPTLTSASPGDMEIRGDLQRIYITGGSSGGGFALSYDYNGILQWNTPISNTGGSMDIGGITADATGNSHILIGFYGTASLPGASFTAASGEKLLMLKLNASGTYTSGGMIGQGTSGQFKVQPEDIDIDGTGNLYIAGNFQSGTLLLSSNPLPNSGSGGPNDAFVAKYNPSYSQIWARQTNGEYNETIDGLCTDNAGNTFGVINNRENNILTFSCYPAFTSVMGNTDDKMLVVKYDTYGNVSWVMDPQVSNWQTALNSVTTNGNGSAYVCGNNTSTTLFGGVTITGIGNAFFARVKGTSQLPVLNGTSICSGYTATLTVTAPVGASFNWYSSPSATTPFHTGSTYTTPVLTNNSNAPIYVTYYVGNSLCTSSRTPVVVQVNPKPNLSSVATNVNICSGNCVTIGLLVPDPNSTYEIYNSTSGSSVLIAHSSSVSVCPNKNSVYSLVVTNQYGCTNYVIINVTVSNNNPAFSLTTTPVSSYFSVSATPVVPYATANSVAGFMYTWVLEELDDLGNVLFTVNNPSCWQNFSTVASLVFNGFDHTSNLYTGNVTLSSCINPPVGRFLYGHTYRITRATKNHSCEWAQYSETVNATKNIITGNPEISIVHDVVAPDFSQLIPVTTTPLPHPDEQLTLYPNPSNGIFTVEWNLLKNANIEITDLMGNHLSSIRANGQELRKVIDLSGYASGVYMVRITINDQVITRRIVLQ